MSDPFGVLAMQRRGDVGVFDGTQWTSSNTGTEVAYPAGTSFGNGKFNFSDGTSTVPVSGDSTRPTVYINRTVKTGATIDAGAVMAKVLSLAGGSIQANVYTAYMDQKASADAVSYGTQMNMEGLGGAGFPFYGQINNNAHTCTITHASPAVVTVAAHGLLAGHEIQFTSRLAITAISIASPTSVTATAHGLSSGDTVYIEGSNSTPSIDGSWVATVTGANTFTIPVNVTGAGTTGTTTSKTLPAGMTGGTRYFVLSAGLTANTFEFATTPGGAAINTTTNGSGTFYVLGNAIWGMTIFLDNESYIPLVYNGSAGVTSSAVLVQPQGKALNGNALRVIAGGAGKLSEGIVFDSASIQNESIHDASSSGTHDLILGTHTTLIDYAGATVTFFLNAPGDATDPTGGGGAAHGRIPINIPGDGIRYLAYY